MARLYDASEPTVSGIVAEFRQREAMKHWHDLARMTAMGGGFLSYVSLTGTSHQRHFRSFTTILQTGRSRCARIHPRGGEYGRSRAISVPSGGPAACNDRLLYLSGLEESC
jgi:hypothetical protein